MGEANKATAGIPANANVTPDATERATAEVLDDLVNEIKDLFDQIDEWRDDDGTLTAEQARETYRDLIDNLEMRLEDLAASERRAAKGGGSSNG